MEGEVAEQEAIAADAGEVQQQQPAEQERASPDEVSVHAGLVSV